MNNDIFNDYQQCEILKYTRIDKLAIIYNYILGCNKVYAIYANYGLLYSLKDEYKTHKSCQLKKEQLKSRYNTLRGSDYANFILEKNENAVCSYCLTSRAEEIDHYLTQSSYPSYAIVYNNLIPSCHSCNHKKHYNRPKDKIWFIQANFEKIPSDFFLTVHFNKDYNRIIFKVPPISEKSKNFLLEKRIEYTFNKLCILKEYSRLAHQELLTIIREFENPINKNENFSDFLQLKYETSCQEANMLWKKSLYKFLKNNDDFIKQGYRAYANYFNIPLKSQ